MQVNVCCLKNKVLQLECLCNEKNVNVICISEHWLQDDQIDLFVPRSFVPANVKCRSLRKNGGVGIYLRNSIQFLTVDVSQFYFELHFEICCVKLTEENLLIVSVYRSPNGDMNMFLDCFERALNYLLNHNSKIVIAGDYNLEMGNTQSRNPAFLKFTNILRSLNLFYTNFQPTRFNSCIDNIIVNFHKNTFNIFLGEHCFADHIPLFLEMYRFKGSQNSPETVSKTAFRKQNDDNVNLFTSYLKETDWDMIYDYMQNKINTETLFNSFFKKYVDLWHYCSPLVVSSNKNVSNRKKLINWYTPELGKLRNDMLKLFTVYKNLRPTGSNQTQAAYNMYIHKKRIYRSKLTEAKKCAVEQYISNAPNKCKAAWEVIREENSPTHSQGVALDPDGTNSYFLNSIKDLNQGISLSPNTPDSFMANRRVNQAEFSWSEVSENEIIKVVSKLSNSKAMDYYWLSNSIIKRTIPTIATPLSFVLNECMRAGYFAPSLKVSKIIPIYKKGDKSLVQNYRPVSIVPIFSKIFESIMYNQLSRYFDSHNLLSDCQYGFRPGKSTTSAIMNIVDHSLEAFENRESVSLVLCDLSKAFDCVPYDILLMKLSHYGMTEDSLKLIKSYLGNRLQYVSVKNSISKMKEVETGVPQGSVLGPFFFIVYINDLPKNLNTHSIIYADDTTLLARHQNLECLQQISKAAQERAYDWFSSNKLACNPDKTQHLTMSLKQDTNMESVKLLGIHIDSKLNWSIHIDSVCKKISRVSYLLWKLKDFVSKDYLRLAYYGLFQSHILYGLLAWGHSTHVSNVLIIQKKAIRNIAGAQLLAHCRPLFIQLKIPTVINLYIFHILLYTKSNLNNFLLRQDIHNHNTRNRSRIDILPHRLALTGGSFKLNCIYFFNKLPEEARIVDFRCFKSKLYDWLVNNPFYSIREFLNSNVDIVF